MQVAVNWRWSRVGPSWRGNKSLLSPATHASITIPVSSTTSQCFLSGTALSIVCCCHAQGLRETAKPTNFPQNSQQPPEKRHTWATNGLCEGRTLPDEGSDTSIKVKKKTCDRETTEHPKSRIILQLNICKETKNKGKVSCYAIYSLGTFSLSGWIECLLCCCPALLGGIGWSIWNMMKLRGTHWRIEDCSCLCGPVSPTKQEYHLFPHAWDRIVKRQAFDNWTTTWRVSRALAIFLVLCKITVLLQRLISYVLKTSRKAPTATKSDWVLPKERPTVFRFAGHHFCNPFSANYKLPAFGK